MDRCWELGAEGAFVLPSGRSVRGRAHRRGVPLGDVPDLGLYLLGHEPEHFSWACRWVRWPDFRLPSDPLGLRSALEQVLLLRSGRERVEIACGGGLGRTGTALACLAVLDGVSATRAVAYVREHYHPRAIETRGQQRLVGQFGR